MHMHEVATMRPMTNVSDASVRAWIRLLRAQRSALSSVERALRLDGLPPLEWYDVLLELDRGGPLRPRDLQERLLLAQSNVSRQLDRMEAEGTIERGRCAEDARGQLVCATAKGDSLRRRMWTTYSAAIEQAIGTKLSNAEAGKLAELLGRLEA